MNKFAQRLNMALDASGMSGADLARKLGISDAIVSQYRSGRYKPRDERLYEIAQILGCSPAWLLGLDMPISEDELTAELTEMIGQLDKVEKARAIDYIEYMIARRKA